MCVEDPFSQIRSHIAIALHLELVNFHAVSPCRQTFTVSHPLLHYPTTISLLPSSIIRTRISMLRRLDIIFTAQQTSVQL